MPRLRRLLFLSFLSAAVCAETTLTTSGELLHDPVKPRRPRVESRREGVLGRDRF